MTSSSLFAFRPYTSAGEHAYLIDFSAYLNQGAIIEIYAEEHEAFIRIEAPYRAEVKLEFFDLNRYVQKNSLSQEACLELSSKLEDERYFRMDAEWTRARGMLFRHAIDAAA